MVSIIQVMNQIIGHNYAKINIKNINIKINIYMIFLLVQWEKR